MLGRCVKQWFMDIAVLMAVAVLAAAVIAGLLQWKSKSLSQRYVNSAALRVVSDFKTLVDLVESSLMAVRDYKVDPSDVDAAKRYLSTHFTTMKKLSGISVAERGGSSIFLMRDGTLVDVRAQGGYDPEERPWFKGALATQACYWTDIYPFRTLEQPGISVSISWEGRHDQPVVAAFDILLDDFFNAVRQLAPTPSSQAFIFSGNGRLYMPEAADMQTESLSVALRNEELARKSLALWNDRSCREDHDNWSEGEVPDLQITALRIDGNLWWCGFVPLETSRRTVWMCVMVPKADIVGDVAKIRNLYGSIGGVVFIAMGILYFIFLRKRNRPVVVDEVAVEQVPALIAKGESETVEFKSTMRMNLHSKKPGKEIELAWLKGVAAFLNTQGGLLLLGVTDAGEITGLEQDVFENDDKCQLHFKNLIATHLGTDVSKHIHFSLKHISGKTVGVVQCSRSSRPVYLRDGNKEAFYIRNGPSSDELPASRLFDYIAEHWK